MYKDFHFYIDFNLDDADRKGLDNFLKELYQLVELVRQHKAKLYYNKKQFDEFSNDIDELYDNFSQSFADKLELILKGENNYFIEEKTSEYYAFQVCFADENTSLNHINSIYSIIKQHNKISLISFSNTIEHFLSVKSNTDFRKIDCVNLQNRVDIVNWVSANTKRIFNLNKKHGENGLGNHIGASVLLCSKEKAQTLLDEAIPCFLDNEKRLYNFDSNTFIIFYYESNNPQNQWHGFHINQNEWEKEIPVFVRKYFEKY